MDKINQRVLKSVYTDDYHIKTSYLSICDLLLLYCKVYKHSKVDVFTGADDYISEI